MECVLTVIVVARREVRKQTCDLIELMETAQPMAHYYLFMEDDFRCVNVL